MKRALAATLGALLLVGSAPADAQVQPFACPSEAEVKTAIEAWRHANNKNALYPDPKVDRFQYGPIRFGQIGDVMTRVGPKKNCPARFSYTFVTTNRSGQERTTSYGDDVTHHFYKDEFGEWAFVIGTR